MIEKNIQGMIERMIQGMIERNEGFKKNEEVQGMLLVTKVKVTKISWKIVKSLNKPKKIRNTN